MIPGILHDKRGEKVDEERVVCLFFLVASLVYAYSQL